MSSIAINNDIPRTMTIQGLEYLGRLARTVPKKGLIVEVGPLFGSSTWVLAKNADPSVRVITIDTWESEPWIKGIEAKFSDCKPFSREAFEYYTRDCANVEIIQGKSPFVMQMQNWNEEIDLFFDDATHGDPGLIDSLNYYLPKLKPGGIACGDDFASGWPDIVARVSDLGHHWGTRPEIIGRVWAIVKPYPNGQTETIYSKIGPYTPYDLAVSVWTQSREKLECAPGAWSGKLHQKDAITALKIDWATTRSDRLSGVYQVKSADGWISPWASFGQWINAKVPVAAVRGHLIGKRAKDLQLSYQVCNIVKGPRNRLLTRNSKTFRDAEWTCGPDQTTVEGISALCCHVVSNKPGEMMPSDK